MRPMKLSLGLVTAMEPLGAIDLAREAEKQDFHRIFIGEDIFHREVYTFLSIIALHTEKIGLATGITSPFTREKTVFLDSIKGVKELSKGRFTLGLGAGGLPEIRRLTGERPVKPLAMMENTVQLIREKTDLKIIMGVRGPRMLELAGRLADGVLLSGPLGYVKEAVRIIDEAAGGRLVEKILWNAFYLGENPKLVSNITGVMMESMPAFALRFMDKTDFEHELCIFGDPDDLSHTIRGLEEMGIDELVVGPPFGRDPIDAIKVMGGLL